MANRRRFLQTGAAVALAPMAGLLNFAKASTASFSEFELNDFVYDERFVGQDTLNTFRFKDDVLLHVINGDLSKLWSTYLNAAWKEKPKTIAGITTADDLFYLERLAWTHGLRVSLRDVSEAMVLIDEKPRNIKLVAWVLEPVTRA